MAQKKIYRQKMDLAKNTRGEYMKKGLLLVVGLALFAAPLSHKFYFFASQQSFRRVSTTVNADHSCLFAAGQPDYQKCHLLSLDKRYSYKHTFGLVFPFLIPIISPKPGKPEHVVPSDRNVVHAIFSSYLRGPPFMAFSSTSI